MEKNESERIDILKFIFAIYVVYIHSRTLPTVDAIDGELINCLKYIFTELIPRCAVSGFYFLSAYLLYRKPLNTKNNLKKKIKTLMVPYFVINTIWILIFAICQNISVLANMFGDKQHMVSQFTFVQWLQAYGVLAEQPFVYPLWFLRNLFLLNCLAQGIKKIIDKIPYISFIVCMFSFFFINYNGIYVHTIDICCWCLGYFAVKFNVNFTRFDAYKNIIKVLYIGSIAISLIAYLRFDVCFIVGLVLERFRIMLGILFAYTSIAPALKAHFPKILSFAKYSFGIYLFHERFLTFTIRILGKLFGGGFKVQLFQYTLFPIFFTLIIMSGIKGLEVFFPSFYAFIMGGRKNRGGGKHLIERICLIHPYNENKLLYDC